MEKVAVILAGGIGERFWPVSTVENPKQFLKIYNNKTLIENTLLRLKRSFNIKNIFVVTNKKFFSKTYNILKKYRFLRKNIIKESEVKNTAPAILFVSFYLRNIYKEAIVFYYPADHLILSIKSFVNDTKIAFEYLKNNNDKVVTFGIKTTHPSTEYGYIKITKKSDEYDIFQVEKFVEKPNLTTAKKYHKSISFFWNSGMFGWNNNLILRLFQKYQRKMYNQFSKKGIDAYKLCEKISIDYAIMEKFNKISMIESSFDWNDVGDWNSLFKIREPDKDKNVINGRVFTKDTRNSVIKNDRGSIGTIGVDNLIIVKQGNDVLICNREKVNRIKELLNDV